MMATPFTLQMILKDGIDHTISINPYTSEVGEVRKGTVAATLNNIELLNCLLLKNPTAEREEVIKSIVDEIDKLIPSLKVIGMFDLFEPVYWVGNGEQMGRVVAVALYIKQYPEKGVNHLREKILSLTRRLESPVLKDLFRHLDSIHQKELQNSI
jgi:hypothetical protein